MAVLSRGLKGIETSKVTASTGLVGQKMMCKVNARELYDSYPFAQYEAAVPIKVTGEYPNFITCDVLPHIANTSQNFGESKPYSISISKFSLMKEEVTLTPMR